MSYVQSMTDDEIAELAELMARNPWGYSDPGNARALLSELARRLLARRELIERLQQGTTGDA